MLQKRPSAAAGFTLLEIMTVVIIIGLLCALAIPVLNRVRTEVQARAFINDLRVFREAFEVQAMALGDWPAAAGNQALPAEMTGAIDPDRWARPNVVGGVWQFRRDEHGFVAALNTAGSQVSRALMTAIDRKIDDGDLDSGRFRLVDQVGYLWVLEEKTGVATLPAGEGAPPAGQIGDPGFAVAGNP
jgi:prepilin-type N-terminal cleavage/methylation domain-containing protein